MMNLSSWHLPTLVMAIPWQGWVVVLCACLSFFMYLTEKISMTRTSIYLITVLVFLFSVAPLEGEGDLWHLLLMGFANPSLIAVMCLLAIGHALYRSGAISEVPQIIFKHAQSLPSYGLIALLLLTAAGVSAFMNNTPVVAIFIPLMSALALHLGRSISQFLIPLSFVCILGGMTTLIGSSTNILAADLAIKQGVELDIFSLAPIGLVLFAVGALYILVVVPYLLPERGAVQLSLPDGTQYLVRVVAHEKHPLVGKTVSIGSIDILGNTNIKSIERGRHVFYAPFRQITIMSEDIITLSGTRTQLLKYLRHFMAPSLIKESYEEPVLAEVLTTPDSHALGMHIQENYEQFAVLGIQRRNRMIRDHWGEILLESGDTLLMFGERKDFDHLQARRDFIVLEQSIIDAPLHSPMPAIIVFALTIVSLILGWLPLPVASLMGACGMLLVRAVNVRQFFRSMNMSLYFLMVSGLALALSLEKTGILRLFAAGLLSWFQADDVVWLASGLFLLAVLMTNLITNATTALICVPLVAEITLATGVNAFPLILAVIYGANCSFVTPVSYQTNILVMTAGHYTYKDYLFVGLPLACLMWATFTLLFFLGFGI